MKTILTIANIVTQIDIMILCILVCQHTEHKLVPRVVMTISVILIIAGILV